MTYGEFIKRLDRKDFISSLYVKIDDCQYKNLLSGFGVCHEKLDPKLKKLLQDVVVEKYRREGPYCDGYSYILYLDIKAESVNTIHAVEVKINGKTYHNKVISEY